MTESHKVFISYGHRDRQWVREFADELSNEGINAWMDEKDIKWGDSWEDKLEEALRRSETMVFIVDPESLTSSNSNFELGVALGAGKRLIAIVDRDVPVKDLPGPIRSRRYLTKERPKETPRDVARALASVD